MWRFELNSRIQLKFVAWMCVKKYYVCDECRMVGGRNYVRMAREDKDKSKCIIIPKSMYEIKTQKKLISKMNLCCGIVDTIVCTSVWILYGSKIFPFSAFHFIRLFVLDHVTIPNAFHFKYFMVYWYRAHATYCINVVHEKNDTDWTAWETASEKNNTLHFGGVSIMPFEYVESS